MTTGDKNNLPVETSDEEEQFTETKVTVSKADFEKYNINSENPTPLQILEAAFLKFVSNKENSNVYGDPFVKKGATLEQAWRTESLLTGKLPVCLFAEGRSNVNTNSITPLVKLNPKELVKNLSGLVDSKGIPIPIMVYNGKLGHSIVLRRHYKENSTFIYFDPWPRNTLLREENNTIGVHAKQVGRQLWSISDDELEKVIVAAFVWKHFWAEYNHMEYYITFNQFKSSDFWSFFNLQEIDTQDFENKKKVFFKTVLTIKEGLQFENKIYTVINSEGHIIEANLKIQRKCIVCEPFGLNPFAHDIVRSFILALTPELDRPNIFELIRTLDKIRNPEELKNFIATQPPPTIPNLTLLVYLGIIEKVNVKLEFSNMIITNTADDDEYLQITTKADEFYSTFH